MTVRRGAGALATRPQLVLLAIMLMSCTSGSEWIPDLSLHDRFVQTALTYSNGEPVNRLIKWSWPMRVVVEGDQTHLDAVARHVSLLQQLTGLPTTIVSDRTQSNVVVTFGSVTEMQDAAERMARYFGHSRASTRYTCFTTFFGNAVRYRVEISIRSDLPQNQIQRCIVQEVTQVLGFNADTDGRTDTTFSSSIGTDHLTEADLALIEILYDGRLRAGMPRNEVLELLPTIMSEVETNRGLETDVVTVD